MCKISRGRNKDKIKKLIVILVNKKNKERAAAIMAFSKARKRKEFVKKGNKEYINLLKLS